MTLDARVSFAAMLYVLGAVNTVIGEDKFAARLPKGVKAAWEVDKSYRESTPTRERICINGLWHWQPGSAQPDLVPAKNWGYFKVPGCWPGITDYMQKDCQTAYTHPNWENDRLGSITTAWYQREITVPSQWADRRIAVSVEYLNSYLRGYREAGEAIARRPVPRAARGMG